MTAAALVGCHRFKAGAVGSIDGSWRRRPAARQNPSPRILPLSRPVIDRAVVALTSTDPPGETTHWTATAMAKTAGISVLNAVEAKVPAGKTIHVIVHDLPLHPDFLLLAQRRRELLRQAQSPFENGLRRVN